ncbi:ketopantoate reductase family protein [Pseudoalteromonas fenneropenaei]|uniref:2-dehydropantoate 2-reductase n=1 Tax=Pseudoalteromonas fenneropenaei TaxID=1737459 RepID=A0ABV7CLS2_9GAMM
MSVNAPLDIAILGAGAIGQLFAKALSRDHQVTVITRKPSTKAWLYEWQTEISTQTIKNATFATLVPSSLRFVLVCVKAYQLPEALAQLRPYLHPAASIVISHNGMSDLSAFSATLTPQHKLYFATTSQGAYLKGPQHVVHRGVGRTWLGAITSAAQSRCPLVDACLTSIVDAHWHHNIAQIRWQKLFVNIAINPLTARDQVCNGQLRAPKYATTVIGLLNEAVHLAALEGYRCVLADALNQAYLVMQQTAANRSSMLQDISLGRQTEITAICGYIVALGKKHHYPTPFNAKLLTEIEALSQV